MNSARIKYISAMLIFGSVGLFVRMLPFGSAQIALGRGLIGCLFLLGTVVLLRKRLSLKRIRADLPVLIFSGVAIGINWILLFMAYRYTSIANATICYYLAPVIVVFLSPVILKERLSFYKICCIIAALLGIVLITGLGGSRDNDLIGIFYGIGAAGFYAAVILLNKFLRHATNMERTIVQLGVSTAALLPYVLLTDSVNLSLISWQSVGLLLTVGILHTGGGLLFVFFRAWGVEGADGGVV